MYAFSGGVSWGPKQKLATIKDFVRMRFIALWHTIRRLHKWKKCGHTNFGYTGIIYHCRCGLDKYT